ncbi:MAG: hypothetical protein FWB73_05940 [Treponema sp.]|nr:hypothetical protein [Treponema sp.]
MQEHGPDGSKEGREKYGIAFNQIRKEFAEKGIEYPTGKTPGFLERVQEKYIELMGDSYIPTPSIPKIKPENTTQNNNKIYSVEEIMKNIDQMNNEMAIKSLLGKTYGGYDFSLAQMETIEGLSDEYKEIIGNTIAAAQKAKKKKYQIKQDLLNIVRINWDSEFLVELAYADNYFMEKILIISFYNEFEYDNEEEAIKTINQSEYLKHYPELKKEILDDALSVINQRKIASDS